MKGNTPLIQPTQKPLFRTPKYTGVTLSLLSVFVLGSMMAVWHRLPKDQASHPISSLVVWSEPNLKPPLDSALSAFRKEFNSTVAIRYLTPSQMLETLQSNNPSKPDLLIKGDANDSISNQLKMLSLENIPLAYHPSSSRSGDKPVKGFVAQNTALPGEALRVARYLAAPDRGQFYFAENKWIGVDGDKWGFFPSLKLHCDEKFRFSLPNFLKTFNEREDSTVEIEFKSGEDIRTGLAIVTQSKAREYLPDAVICHPTLELAFKQYRKIGDSKHLDFFLLYPGPNAQICKRLHSKLATFRDK